MPNLKPSRTFCIIHFCLFRLSMKFFGGMLCISDCALHTASFRPVPCPPPSLAHCPPPSPSPCPPPRLPSFIIISTICYCYQARLIVIPPLYAIIYHNPRCTMIENRRLVRVKKTKFGSEDTLASPLSGSESWPVCPGPC